MLTNTSIPSLVGGVSQQPPALRHATQVDASDNMVPSLASGLRKRTGHQYIAKLAPAGVDYKSAFVHTIDRGTGERYFLVINNATLKVFDFSGNERVVNAPQTFDYLLGSTNAREDFRATTVADYTFITHKNRKVEMLAATPATPSNKVYVVIKTGVASQTYYVTLNGTTYSYTTGSSSASTADIATNLANSITAGGAFTATRRDNLIICTPGGAVPANYGWGVTDTYGDQASFGFRDTVARYEDLPRKFVENAVIHVTGGPDGSNAGYYVKWTNSGDTADGVWIETVKPGITTTLAPYSMPYILVRESNGTFTFKEADWKQRLIGDDTSNPVPSFVGSPIAEVFFHRNRLGFLADENVVLSSAADYFNFFATSARADVDSDPVDVSASTTKVTYLKHVVPFDKSLLIFADKAQFEFSAGQTLTGKTAKLDVTTSFEASMMCPPVAMGRTVFFATDRGNYTSLREYFYDGNSVANDAADVTAHVPSYVPTGIFKLTAAPTEDTLFALSALDGQRNCVYVYNSAWNGDEKAQSAWHRWVFDPQDLIVSADVFGTTLAFIVQRPDGLYLDMMPLEERPASPAPFTICLDRWVGFSDGFYNAGQKRTFWTLPYALPAAGVPVAVVCNKTGEVGQGLTMQIESSNTVSLPGDYRNTTVPIGIQYNSMVRLSPQFPKDAKGNSIINTRTQMRDMVVEYDRTGYFEAHVTPAERDTDRYVMSGRNLGISGLKLGTETILGGQFKFAVMCRADEVTIELHNPTHLPCSFLSAEWQGHIAMQAGRR